MLAWIFVQRECIKASITSERGSPGFYVITIIWPDFMNWKTKAKEES